MFLSFVFEVLIAVEGTFIEQVPRICSWAFSALDQILVLDTFCQHLCEIEKGCDHAKTKDFHEFGFAKHIIRK